uniref:Uncharacterized protein n=1 Tax=Arundo donax TaxID=35708 RepID=A0A0A8ZVH1_ARUDO
MVPAPLLHPCLSLFQGPLSLPRRRRTPPCLACSAKREHQRIHRAECVALASATRSGNSLGVRPPFLVP